jgi:hexokinase
MVGLGPKKPPSRKGTDLYVDVPKDLLKEIERLEQLFSIDTAKLKQITDHFVNELEKGRCTASSLRAS